MPKTVLIVSPTPSHPQNSGSRMRVFTLIGELRRQGHDVHFIHVTREAGDADAMKAAWSDRFHSFPYRDPLGPPRRAFDRLFSFASLLPLPKRVLDWMMNRPVDYWYDDALDAFVANLHGRCRFDAVIVVYVVFSRVLLRFDAGVRKIIDTLDVFTNRHMLYIDNRQVPSWYTMTAEEEARGLDRADVIVAIQAEEGRYFETLVAKPVVPLGHLIAPVERLPPSPPSRKLLFVGSAIHPNIQGLKRFIRGALPQVRAVHPTLELLIVGPICAEIGDHEGCVKLGIIPDTNEIYGLAEIVINCATFGTGLKIKSVEALAFGKALVTTPDGAAGLEAGDGTAFLVAETPEALAPAILRLLSDVEFFTSVTRNAREFAAELYRANILAVQDLLSQP